jgi:hypothetical protein
MQASVLPRRARSSTLAAYARDVLAECDALDVTRLAIRRYALPFLDIEARFTDPAQAEDCDHALVTQHAASVADHFVRLTRADGATPGVSPPALWDETYFMPLEIERLVAQSDLRASFFHDGRIWEFYDRAARKGASIAPARGAYPPWERSAPLRAMLNWAYAALGLRLAHAATLGLDGRGVLIAGQGGAGKSGLTLAGIAAGLDSVGDDYVLVDPRGAPTAYPLFRFTKQDRAGLRRLGLAHLAVEAGPTNWQGKHEIDLERIGRGRRASSLVIDAILVPTIVDRAATSIETIGRRDAMLALAPTGLMQLPGDRQEGARTFAELVRKLPAFRIAVGSDPALAAGAVADFLRGLAR